MEPFDTFILKKMLVQLGGVIAIAAILGAFIIAYNATYNNVTNLYQTVDERWEKVTVDMAERYGHIPELEAFLGASSGSHAPALGNATRNLDSLKAALSDGKMGKINSATTNLEVSVSNLATVLKGHPMEGSREVRDFVGILERTEKSLSGDRLSYNEAVRKYNLAITTFPASLWTENWGFARREYFTARIGGQEPPPVPPE